MKNKNKYYCLIASMFSLLVTSFDIRNEDDLITWDKNYKLKWDDFKGKIDINDVSSVAISSSDLKLISKSSSNNTYKLFIGAIFNRHESWGKTKSKAVLKHEQGHFDITEIYARLLRKKLNNQKFKNNKLSIEIESIFLHYTEEKNDRQKLYDVETDHCKNQEKQEEWFLKIEKQLKDLERYNSTEIIVMGH